MSQLPNRTYFNPSNAAISESFDIEFDDAILETRFWKSRAEGSQLQATSINKFTSGDISFGKNPVIENKIAALYIGTTIIGGESGNSAEDPSRVALNGHSYITLDKILLINLDTDEVQIIERQSLVDISTGTTGDEKAFKRFVTRDFNEGSEINIRLLDKTVANSLKPSHFVKFNRGSLMKIYEYTANDDGFEDGVFGGFNVKNNKDGLHTGSLAGPGLFGYGMTAAVSRSLFTTDSIKFVGSLPSELNDYTGDLNLSTLGTELAPITASRGSGFEEVAEEIPSLRFRV
jgi:hypothetical protein|tara:strand:- start:38 stop:904 length:867 start_codon:yes stop_codon:yes gene_type:complete